MDGGGIETRGLGQRRLEAFQHVLGFSVAQQLDSLRARRRDAEGGKEENSRNNKAGRKSDLAPRIPVTRTPANRADTRQDQASSSPVHPETRRARREGQMTKVR
jgi:hypothetical protein